VFFKLNFSFGKVKVSPSDSDDDQKSEVLNGYDSCFRKKDFYLVSTISYESAKKRIDIERFDTLAEQMSFADQCISEIRQAMRSKFLSLLKEITGKSEGLISTHESSNHILVMKVLVYELKDVIRRKMQENHLADKTDQEFENYIEVNIRYLNNVITTILDDNYPDNVNPSRERVYETNMQMGREMDNLLEKVLRRARIIAIEKNNLSLEEEKKMYQQIQDIVK